MPPASLSTFAVMMPGPITASSAARRTRPDRSDVLRAARRTSVLPPEQIDDVVCRDDSGEASVFVHDGKREQVVLVEQLDDFVFRRVEVTADERFRRECGERRASVRNRRSPKGSGAGE